MPGARRARAEPREPRCPVETVVGEESVTETSDRSGAGALGGSMACPACEHAMYARSARCPRHRNEARGATSCINCCVRGRPGDDAWCWSACLCRSAARPNPQLLRARAAGRRRVVRVSVQLARARILVLGKKFIANRFIANANQVDRPWTSRPQRPEESAPGTLPLLRHAALIPPSSSRRCTSSEGSLV